MAQDNVTPLVKQDLPWSRRIAFGFQIRAIQTVAATAGWLGSCIRSADAHPDLTKTYAVRPHLPVRIFLPSSFVPGSSDTLPTLFTIHGGGFCMGSTQDDDAWNRSFADTHSILVIALNYSKAPAAPFPTALDDLTSLYLAALDDQSLPIDRANGGRVAVCGFSAGGSLALGLSQRLLRSKEQDSPSSPCLPQAAVSVYGALDLSRPPETKIPTRQFKTDASLGPPRTSDQDFLLGLAPLFDYSYLPDGQDLRDPYVSPGPYADRKHLPPHIFIIAAELDMLANDSLECARRLASGTQDVSSASDAAPTRCGRPEAGKFGELELDDERFAWQVTQPDGGSVRWLLVPDVLHGFDSLPLRRRLGGEETMKDAELKTKAYCDILGDWLLHTVFTR